MILNHVLAAGGYFLNFYILIPFLYYRRKVLYYTVVLLYALLILYIDPVHMPLPQLLPLAVAFMLSYIARKRFEWQQLSEEKIKFELTTLKQQMQPHFFFNTLNGIYGLAISQSDKTPGSILQLAGMMRYVLYESNTEKVPLRKEIEHIDNYFQLQQLRMGPNNHVALDIQVQELPEQIAPFLLIPFIENNFKHGISANKDTQMHVVISYTAGTLYFNSVNTIVASDTPGGVGLSNVKRRLELLYPGRHTLFIDQRDQHFIVQLSIRL